MSEAAMVVVSPLCVAAEIQSCHLDIGVSCSIDEDQAWFVVECCV